MAPCGRSDEDMMVEIKTNVGPGSWGSWPTSSTCGGFIRDVQCLKRKRTAQIKSQNLFINLCSLFYEILTFD